MDADDMLARLMDIGARSEAGDALAFRRVSTNGGERGELGDDVFPKLVAGALRNFREPVPRRVAFYPPRPGVHDRARGRARGLEHPPDARRPAVAAGADQGAVPHGDGFRRRAQTGEENRRAGVGPAGGDGASRTTRKRQGRGGGRKTCSPWTSTRNGGRAWTRRSEEAATSPSRSCRSNKQASHQFFFHSGEPSSGFTRLRLEPGSRRNRFKNEYIFSPSPLARVAPLSHPHYTTPLGSPPLLRVPPPRRTL